MIVMVSLKMALPAGQHCYAFNSFYQVVEITDNEYFSSKKEQTIELTTFVQDNVAKMAAPVNFGK